MSLLEVLPSVSKSPARTQAPAAECFPFAVEISDFHAFQPRNLLEYFAVKVLKRYGRVSNRPQVDCLKMVRL